MPDAQKVNTMFGRIAGRYDLANRLLSMGIDRIWRERLVEEVAYRNPRSVVDLATGSGDVAFALREGLPSETSVRGMDFCQPMLDEAEFKKQKFGYKGVSFSIGDVLDLPLADQETDAVTISFGYRNLAERRKGLLEMKRVLNAKKGHVFILEFSQPNALYRPFYYFYLKHFLPTAASFITGNREAYQYLCSSIEAFPDREGITKELEEAGFSGVEAIPMTFGTVALHIGKA